ncbi:Peptidyl-tRNA hydrolase PTH2 family protein [Leishmania donovani]|nr:Peptidyl-tRNA hydrolase PTH2 family protein [Leishmania donovani]TPP45802.1 Peptidyl-tRNA hydrolase PTH2 family protein [Leishmania donovani]
MAASDSVLDETAWTSACATGTVLGCAVAFFCAAIVQRLTSRHAASKEAVASPLLSRRDRAAKLLEELHRQSATAATGHAHAAEGAASDKDSWKSATSGSSDESSDTMDVDSEYEQMEALRLKMVFVVSSRVQPKITAQEVAVLTASAGVQLVELLQQETKLSAAVSVPASESLCAADSQDHQRWRHWYLWWNRIGCGKITLKCPDKDTMELVVATARKHRLPMAMARRSETAVTGGEQVEIVAKPSDVVVVALGPAPSDVLEPITGSLKLFS